MCDLFVKAAFFALFLTPKTFTAAHPYSGPSTITRTRLSGGALAHVSHISFCEGSDEEAHSDTPLLALRDSSIEARRSFPSPRFFLTFTGSGPP